MGKLISRPVDGQLEVIYKEQKIISISQFESLPNEVIMHVLSYLKIGDLLNCGLVSKRFRAISNHDLLWPKMVNLCYKKVPVGFLQKLLDSGCKYLSLSQATLEGNLNLSKPSGLIYLILCGFISSENSEKMLESSPSLQKLSLSRFHLSAKLIRIISLQNGKTLKVLDLSKCNFCIHEKICTRISSRKGCSYRSYAVPVQEIVENCTELKELSLHMTKLSESSTDFLVSNLTSKIEKLDLFNIPCLKDEHVKKLVTRCNRITELNLGGRNSITKLSLNFIIEHLQLTLVKLGVKNVQFNFLKLKSMKKLKILCIDYNNWSHLDRTMLKKLLPKLTIFYYDSISPIGPIIAVPNHRRFNECRGLWEIKVEREKLFETV